MNLLSRPGQEVAEFRRALRSCFEPGIAPAPDERLLIFERVRLLLEQFQRDPEGTQRVTDVRSWFAAGVRELRRTDDAEVNYYAATTGKSGGQKAKLAFTLATVNRSHAAPSTSACPAVGSLRGTLEGTPAGSDIGLKGNPHVGRCKIATLQVLLCAMAESSTFYFTSVFGLSYGIQTLGLGNGLLLAGVAIGNAVGIITNPLFGALSDRVGRRPLLGASYLLAAVYVLVLFFPLLRTGDPAIVILAMAIPGALLQPMSLAVSGSFYPERFDDARLRLSGVSLGRQFGTILGGGIMPMVSASLLAWSGGSLTWVLAYFVFVCALALGSVVSSRETAGAAWGRHERTVRADVWSAGPAGAAGRLRPSSFNTRSGMPLAPTSYARSWRGRRKRGRRRP